MKLSKLDPMTVLMLVVAFGVVITMLTQNSIASVDNVALESIEKSVLSDKAISKVRLSAGNSTNRASQTATGVLTAANGQRLNKISSSTLF